MHEWINKKITYRMNKKVAHRRIRKGLHKTRSSINLIFGPQVVEPEPARPPESISYNLLINKCGNQDPN